MKLEGISPFLLYKSRGHKANYNFTAFYPDPLSRTISNCNLKTNVRGVLIESNARHTNVRDAVSRLIRKTIVPIETSKFRPRA
jgi:hypothetical protein